MNIREVWYPPADLAKAGRANRAGGPVLYCATLRGTAIQELRPALGSTVAVGTWTNTEKLRLTHLGYGEASFEALGSGRKNGSWTNERVLIPGDEKNREVADLLSKTFTMQVAPGDEHKYKLSIAMAELFLSADVDALLYPSIQTRGNSDNLAIPPRFADKHLRFRRITFGTIVEETQTGYVYVIVDTATSLLSDGRILWTGSVASWARQAKVASVSYENGTWVERDANGRVINDGDA